MRSAARSSSTSLRRRASGAVSGWRNVPHTFFLGMPSSPSICWPIKTGGNFHSRAMSRMERPFFHWRTSRGNCRFTT